MALSEVQRARNHVGVVARTQPGSEALKDARRNLAAEKLATYVSRTVESAPPLTPEQRDRIASLLRSGSAA
jgi:hypothetical protein